MRERRAKRREREGKSDSSSGRKSASVCARILTDCKFTAAPSCCCRARNWRELKKWPTSKALRHHRRSPASLLCFKFGQKNNKKEAKPPICLEKLPSEGRARAFLSLERLEKKAGRLKVGCKFNCSSMNTRASSTKPTTTKTMPQRIDDQASKIYLKKRLKESY